MGLLFQHTFQGTGWIVLFAFGLCFFGSTMFLCTGTTDHDTKWAVLVVGPVEGLECGGDHGDMGKQDVSKAPALLGLSVSYDSNILHVLWLESTHVAHVLSKRRLVGSMDEISTKDRSCRIDGGSRPIDPYPPPVLHQCIVSLKGLDDALLFGKHNISLHARSSIQIDPMRVGTHLFDKILIACAVLGHLGSSRHQRSQTGAFDLATIAKEFCKRLSCGGSGKVPNKHGSLFGVCALGFFLWRNILFVSSFGCFFLWRWQRQLSVKGWSRREAQRSVKQTRGGG
mmetsp:Transcript_20358/g.47124  ORF Transcript_20358/g.47124 Transcript_20358/m.47124 type:complete len:284 (-) Transcript_20358:122-973(-)